MINDGLDKIKIPEDVVIYNDKVFFILINNMFGGKNNDKPAFLYLIYDFDIYKDEFETIRKQLPDVEIIPYFFIEREEKFKAYSLLSGKEHGRSEIFQEYAKRINIEPIIRSSKKDISLFSFANCNNESSLGKILVGFYSLVVLRILQFLLKGSEFDAKSALSQLSN